MTFMGRMQGGSVVFDGEKPQEGTIVRVEPVDEATKKETTVGDRLLKWAGLIEDGPTDGAVNVDHYLYGLPKK